jgi:hypothetical protein
MKQFPQGIFQTLNWLVKQVDLLKYQVANPVTPPTPPTPGGLTTVEVDGITVQGNGISSSNPIKSLMLSQTYDMSDQGSLTLGDFPTKSVFLVNADANVPPVGPTDIVFPTVVDGLRLIIINNSGYQMNISVSGASVVNAGGSTASSLLNDRTYEIVGINTAWYILSRFPA